MIKSRRIMWLGRVAHMGEMRNTYKSLIGKPEGKRPLGRHRCGWEDNVEREIGLEGVVWIHLA
jgi:hypothetical protein